MDYELAKQLKDAGFPMVAYIKGNPICGRLFGIDCTITEDTAENFWYIPTLSELILEVYKYCHEVRLECVKDRPGVWASCTCWGNGYEDDWKTGSSPEKSLAKPWLTLQ